MRHIRIQQLLYVEKGRGDIYSIKRMILLSIKPWSHLSTGAQLNREQYKGLILCTGQAQFVGRLLSNMLEMTN